MDIFQLKLGLFIYFDGFNVFNGYQLQWKLFISFNAFSEFNDDELTWKLFIHFIWSIYINLIFIN